MAMSALVGVKSYWYGAPLPEKSAYGLLDALCADINAVGGNVFWNNVTLPQIRLLLNALHMSNRDGYSQALEEKIKEVLARRFHKDHLDLGGHLEKHHDCYSDMELHDHLIKPKPAPSPEPGKHTILQGNQTPDRFCNQALFGKQFLERASVELTAASNHVMQRVFKTYPNTTSLIIRYRPSLYNHLTDMGLEWIKLDNHLQTLELNLWEAPLITREGLDSLLRRCPRLRFLSLTTCLVDDSILTTIALMPNLERLSIISPSITSKGLELLTQSVPLKRQLRALTLRKGLDWGVLVSNQLLVNLSSFANLKELCLDGKGEFDSQNLENVLRKQNLTHLHLNGFPISLQAFLEIHRQSYLFEQIYLGDCSGIDAEKWSHICQQQPPLEKLASFGITCGTVFRNPIVMIGKKYPQLSEFSLTQSPWFTLSSLQVDHFVSLTYLEIADNNQIPSTHFATALKKLTRLEILRVNNCRSCNDDAIEGLAQANSPLKALELNRVTIGDRGMTRVAALKQLDTLSITACGGVTTDGWKEFLGNPELQCRIRKLQLNLMNLGKQAIPLFRAFTKLDVLMIRAIPTFEEESEYNHLLLDYQQQQQQTTSAPGLQVGYLELDFGNAYTSYSSWPRFIDAHALS